MMQLLMNTLSKRSLKTLTLTTLIIKALTMTTVVLMAVLVKIPLAIATTVAAKNSDITDNTCAAIASKLSAEFKLLSEGNTTKILSLHRQNKRVGHQVSNAPVFEVWSLWPDGRTAPTRYFIEAKRGIEYQPADLNRGQGTKDWDQKYQLLASANFSGWNLVNESSSGCETTQTYERTFVQGTTLQGTGKIEETIIWYPEIKLPKLHAHTVIDSLGKKTQSILLSTQMLDLTGNKSQTFFAKLNQYNLMDYADIGDNESDPFLLSMINLGFIDHGASGFYSQDGKALDSDHQHHNH